MPLIATAILLASQQLSFDTESIRKQAEQAIGTVPAAGLWTAKGIAQYHGLWEKYEMVWDGQYRFKTAITGPLPRLVGFDGKESWVSGTSGVPHRLSGSDRELSRAVAYVLTGSWASAKAPVTLKSQSSSEPSEFNLELKCADGTVPCTLTVDAKNWQPKSLSHWGTTGTDSILYSDFRQFNGVRIPMRYELSGGDENFRVLIQSVKYERDGKADFRQPIPESDNFTFDLSVSPKVEVKRIFNYLFVRPKLNGQEEGWFFFDTGADVMVIDTKVAEKLAATTIGSESTAGVVGNTKMSIAQGIQFHLGPLTLERPTFFQLDLAGFSKIFGIPVVGICGYDFISRASIDIDPKESTIGVYPPGRASLPKGATWTKFEFNSNIPKLTCRFEGDRIGVFDLDTGSGSAVEFLSPTVEKLGLLKDRKVTTSFTGGAGGTAESRAGTVDWFEIAGNRFEKVNAVFQLTKKGVFASPYFDGNIGMGLMRNFHLVLDYQNSRLSMTKVAP